MDDAAEISAVTDYANKGRFGGSWWEDLRFPAQGINPPGAVSDPAVESTTGLLLFSASATNLIGGVAQLPHGWVEESVIEPHIHWQKTTSAAGNVLWRFEYEVVDNGAVAAMTYANVVDSLTSLAPDTNTANLVLVNSFGNVVMTGKHISCMMLWKLSRIGGDGTDTYGANARLLELDIHYQLNQAGSDQLYRKYLDARQQGV